jgi:hypothetical protein
MPWAMAEDEAACLKIGWQPYHVQKGFDLNQSTLTAASALMWGNNLTPASHDGAKIMEMMAWDAVEKGQFATGSGPRLTNRTLLITSMSRAISLGPMRPKKNSRRHSSRPRAGRRMSAPIPITGPIRAVRSLPATRWICT